MTLERSKHSYFKWLRYGVSSDKQIIGSGECLIWNEL